MDNVETAVVKALKLLEGRAESLGDGSSVWTRAIKDAVGDVGVSLGFQVYAAECKFEENGEWLYDLSWFQEDNDSVIDMPLALESEWAPRDIMEDFQKLLVSRAGYRVMVFWAQTVEARQRNVDKMITQIQRYQRTQKNDRYLFCCWVEDSDKFEIESYVVKQPS